MLEQADPWGWASLSLRERQIQFKAAYDAQTMATLLCSEDDDVALEEVASFSTKVLADVAPSAPQIVFVLDLDDAAALNKLLTAESTNVVGPDDIHGLTVDGVVHLHPRYVDRWLVLHEIAHALVPLGGHGLVWCRALVELVRVGIGDQSANTLEDQLAAHEAAVAAVWRY